MVREGLSDVPLIVESAQVFDTHHVALLVAAGASAVLPYLADEFAESLEPGGVEKARAAINAGLRKVLARMGVSTVASYRNAFQLLLAALAYTTAFQGGLPLIGVPVLVLVAAELYLLATPEARLAYLER